MVAGAAVVVGATVVVVGVVVVGGTVAAAGAVVVVAVAAISEPPPHAEANRTSVTAEATALMAQVCHPSPEGGRGRHRSPTYRYAQAS